MQYDHVFPNVMLVFLLTATYAVIQPMLIGAAFLAFAIGWV